MSEPLFAAKGTKLLRLRRWAFQTEVALAHFPIESLLFFRHEFSCSQLISLPVPNALRHRESGSFQAQV